MMMILFFYAGLSNGESLTLCHMKSMAMEPCHTRALYMSSEESLEASMWHCKQSITCMMYEFVILDQHIYSIKFTSVLLNS